MTPRDERERLIVERLGERYALVEFLGKGGFAAVYKVKSRSLERPEALKVLLERRSGEEFAQRFRQEARLAASLDHPNIIRIYDFGQVDDLFWYTMQLVNGPTIASELEAMGGRLEEKTAIKIAISVLDALDYSHERGVVHRDIKPENLILDAQRRPYVMDYGIAKSEESTVETRTGFILGSPSYLSPEQTQGQKLDGRSDIYSFGITLYEMLSGELPFTADDRHSMMLKRLTTAPAPLRDKRPGVDPDLEAIVMKSLARERQNRYQTAREMKEELEELLADRTAASRPGLRKTTDPGVAPSPAAPAETIAGAVKREDGSEAATVASVAPGLDRGLTRAVPKERETAPTMHIPAQAPTPGPPPVPGPGPVEIPAAAVAPRASSMHLVGIVAAIFFVVGGLGTFIWIRTRPTYEVQPRPTVAVPTPAPAIPASVVTAPPAAPVAQPTAAEPTRAPIARFEPTKAPPKVAVHLPRATEPVANVDVRAAKPPLLDDSKISLVGDLAEACRGSYVINAVVRADGTVKEAHVRNGTGISERCNESIEKAVTQSWRFQPARNRQGVAIEYGPFGTAFDY